MEAFTLYLSSNPVIAYTLLAIILAIAGTLIWLTINAYREGRQVTLGVFKIESKSSVEHGLTSKGTVKSITESGFPESILLSNRKGFPKSLDSRLENAQTVCLMGINLNSIISHYDGFITKKAIEGCKFKLLTVDPRFFDIDAIEEATWPGGMRSLRDLGHSINSLEQLANKVANKNIQLAYISFPPPYTQLMIDPDKLNGEIQIELYTYEQNTRERPHLGVTKLEVIRSRSSERSILGRCVS